MKFKAFRLTQNCAGSSAAQRRLYIETSSWEVLAAGLVQGRLGAGLGQHLGSLRRFQSRVCKQSLGEGGQTLIPHHLLCEPGNILNPSAVRGWPGPWGGLSPGPGKVASLLLRGAQPLQYPPSWGRFRLDGSPEPQVGMQPDMRMPGRAGGGEVDSANRRQAWRSACRDLCEGRTPEGVRGTSCASLTVDISLLLWKPRKVR